MQNKSTNLRVADIFVNTNPKLTWFVMRIFFALQRGKFMDKEAFFSRMKEIVDEWYESAQTALIAKYAADDVVLKYLFDEYYECPLLIAFNRCQKMCKYLNDLDRGTILASIVDRSCLIFGKYYFLVKLIVQSL